MWTMIEGPKVVKATNALAKRFHEMDPAPHDRPLKERIITNLTKAMKEGTFRTCEWSSAYCKETKKEYRINGKHTSTILVGMNGDSPTPRVILTRFECETLEDVARVYSTFDSRLGVRSTGDINKIYAASNPELSDIRIGIITACVYGLSYATWGESYFTRSPEDRAELLLGNVDFVKFIDKLVTGSRQGKATFGVEHIRRGPVFTAIYKTFVKSKSDSKEFWEEVRDENDGDNRSPSRVLARWLRSVSVRGTNGKGGVTAKATTAPREMIVKCLHAWNAWRADSYTDLKYYAKVDMPEVR